MFLIDIDNVYFKTRLYLVLLCEAQI